jgi:xanthine dehydrogenase accessory factor
MLTAALKTFLAQNRNTVRVEIAEARGSTPRAAGTMMLVGLKNIWGTIGGGQFEFLAIDHARAMLAGQTMAATLDIPLGPEIGQCCGGRTLLRFALGTPEVIAHLQHTLSEEARQQPDVTLFGAGHVGRALAAALAPLPLTVTVIETRADELLGLPDTIATRHVAMPEALVANIRPGGAAIILTHDHALDFLIAREALARGNKLAYVGMIGSATKRATFASWLRREGGDPAWVDHLTLPIGGTAVKDKRPSVIAALVAAELLVALEIARGKPQSR